jgi:hypothetical protein
VGEARLTADDADEAGGAASGAAAVTSDLAAAGAR